MNRLRAATWAAVPLLATLLAAAPLHAAIEVVNLDGPGEGFNDPTPASPVGGNPGTTVGEQRRFVFQQVAAAWDARVQSPVPIVVGASFDELECTPTQATLGAAGPAGVVRDFPNAPRAATWYVSAAANALAGVDLEPGSMDITARFSGRLGAPGCGFRWYYGVDGQPASGQIELFSVVLHELGHGLGFLKLFDSVSGEKFFGFDDAYLANLVDATTGGLLRDMSNAERAAACVKPEQLHWIGPAVTSASGGLTSGVGPNDRVHLYSPNPLRVAASVSHYSTSLSPNELMEPSYTGATRNLDLTRALLTDVGWSEEGPVGPCAPSSNTLCLLGGRFAVTSRWSDGGAAGLRDAFVAAPSTSGEISSAGLFHFFAGDPDNWEILVKMIDGCVTNERFWVLVSASTGFQWELEVTDTTTGARRVYAHPLDGLASGVSDFAAFGTCGN